MEFLENFDLFKFPYKFILFYFFLFFLLFDIGFIKYGIKIIRGLRFNEIS